MLLIHFKIVELSLASHLHIELTPSLFDEKTQQVRGTIMDSIALYYPMRIFPAQGWVVSCMCICTLKLQSTLHPYPILHRFRLAPNHVLHV